MHPGKGSPLTPRICDDNRAGIEAGFKVSTNSSLVTVLFDADDSESGRGFLLRKSYLIHFEFLACH